MNQPSHPYQYIVLHSSCRNHVGVAAVQAAHAAAESVQVAPISKETYVCVLEAKTSEDLERLAEKLTAAGVHHALIREPDEPYFGAATAVGIAPQERGNVRAFVAEFKVFRRSAPSRAVSAGET